MPKTYKSFQIPTGQDEANIPFIFEQFIDSGMKSGSVIAHFATIQQANLARGDFPQGAFAWVQAVLCRYNGVSFEPVMLSPTMGHYMRFFTKADRDAHYSAGGPGGVPAAGQVAMVGANGLLNLTLHDGTAWTDNSDLMIRQKNFIGDHNGGTVSIGDPANPYSNPTGFRKAAGWAVNLAGHTFVDGKLQVNTSIQAPTLTVNGNSTLSGVTYVGRIQGWDFAPKHLNWPAEGGNIVCIAAVTFETGIHVKGHHDGSTLNLTGAFNCGILNCWGGDHGVHGNLLCSGGVIAAGFMVGSDSRLKSDIKTAPTGALAIVDSIPVKTYEIAGSRSTYGWVAQDVEKSLPTAVVDQSVTATGSDEPMFGVDGLDMDTVKTLDTTEMTATLWAAVQELSAEVKSLREQLGTR